MNTPVLCAEAGHQFVSLYLFHCEHVGEHVLYVSRGTAEQAEPTTSTIRFGPFDTIEDVLDYVRGLVVQVL